jgi:hypothetical protein
MITIENIKRIEQTIWNFNDGLIPCVKAEEINDSLASKNSYIFDFDIGLGDVPLVIWLDRHKDDIENGYRFENNLVEATNYVNIKQLASYTKFIVMLQDYLTSIEPEIKKNFFK